MAKSKFKPRNGKNDKKSSSELKVKDKIQKKQKPVKKSVQAANILARKAIGAGEVETRN